MNSSRRRLGLRIKIVLLVDQLNLAGSQKRAVKLARSLDPKRFEVRMVCLFGGGPLAAEVAKHGLASEILDFDPNPRSPRNLAGMWKLFRLLRRERPDVVHSFSFYCGIYGTIAARAARVPVIVSSRMCLYDLRPDAPLLRLVERLLNSSSSAFVAISQAVADDTIRCEGVPAEKLELVYNGVEPLDAADASREQTTRASLGVSDDTALVACVANLFAYKRHDTLIEAAPALVASRPAMKFLMIGRDAGELASLQRLAEEKGVAEAFVWLGERNDVSSLLAVSEVGVLCSASEAMSNSVLEYMEARLPVVASDVGGNPEMVVDGETGFLFPIGDSVRLAERIGALLDDPPRAKRMGEAGRTRVREVFSLARMVCGYAAVYEKQMAARRAA
jgi:glycosyltransferase involved in cell wall biosynthesis